MNCNIQSIHGCVIVQACLVPLSTEKQLFVTDSHYFLDLIILVTTQPQD